MRWLCITTEILTRTGTRTLVLRPKPSQMRLKDAKTYVWLTHWPYGRGLILHIFWIGIKNLVSFSITKTKVFRQILVWHSSFTFLVYLQLSSQTSPVLKLANVYLMHTKNKTWPKNKISSINPPVFYRWINFWDGRSVFNSLVRVV